MSQAVPLVVECLNCTAPSSGHTLCRRCSLAYELRQSLWEHTGAGAYDFGDNAAPGVTIRMLQADRLVNADMEGSPGVRGFGPLWKSTIAASVVTGASRTPRGPSPQRPTAGSVEGCLFAAWCEKNPNRVQGAELAAVVSVYDQGRGVRETARRMSFCERRVSPGNVRTVLNRAYAKYRRASRPAPRR